MEKTEAVLLRIFVKETDKSDGKPLYLAIVEAARAEGLAGATVLRGVVGFGSANDAPNAQPQDVSSEAPMVIEIVDWEDRADAFIARMTAMMDRGLVTTQKIGVDWYVSTSTG